MKQRRVPLGVLESLKTIRDHQHFMTRKKVASYNSVLAMACIAHVVSLCVDAIRMGRTW